jgi:hypothetical protein
LVDLLVPGRSLGKLIKLFVQKTAAEFYGAAGEFCCHSLHRSQISKDL